MTEMYASSRRTYWTRTFQSSNDTCIVARFRSTLTGPKKSLFCVPTDELLRAKDDLLSEGGQSLNSIFADCFGDWFIGILFVGDDVVAKCINKLH